MDSMEKLVTALLAFLALLFSTIYLTHEKTAGALRFWDSGTYRCLELRVEPLVTSGGGVAFHDGRKLREAAGQWHWTKGGKCDE